MIAHCVEDGCLPIEGSYALYYALANSGHEVYFIEKTGQSHCNVFERGYMPACALEEKDVLYEKHVEAERKDRRILLHVLQQHGIVKSECDLNVTDDQLKTCQPDIAQDPKYKQCYDKLIAQERKHEIIGYGLKAFIGVVAVAAVSCIGYKLYQKYRAKKDDTVCQNNNDNSGVSDESLVLDSNQDAAL